MGSGFLFFLRQFVFCSMFTGFEGCVLQDYRDRAIAVALQVSKHSPLD
ncbi:hypothetical protein Riv7116_6924 (plasmid) [Rivularia sp. PCC 7116]|nr:hypothetical protein Riv7116_6923 [Rivularia sp. PCC 7116]AFY59236.1 hypothetical protein Riv7116_6924 [Rivularia sp. PCC 7116]